MYSNKNVFYFTDFYSRIFKFICGPLFQNLYRKLNMGNETNSTNFLSSLITTCLGHKSSLDIKGRWITTLKGLCKDTMVNRHGRNQNTTLFKTYDIKNKVNPKTHLTKWCLHFLGSPVSKRNPNGVRKLHHNTHITVFTHVRLYRK